jgi:hypothetical protein
VADPGATPVGWEEVAPVAGAAALGWEKVALVVALAAWEEDALVAGVAAWKEVALVAGVAAWKEVALMAGVAAWKEVALVVVLAAWEEVALVAGVAAWKEVALVVVLAALEEVALVAGVAAWKEVALVAGVAAWKEVALVAGVAAWKEVALAVKNFDLVLLLPRMEATAAPKFCYSNECNCHQVHNQHPVVYEVYCDTIMPICQTGYTTVLSKEQGKSFQKSTSHEGLATFGKYPQERNKRILLSFCRWSQSMPSWRRWWQTKSRRPG